MTLPLPDFSRLADGEALASIELPPGEPLGAYFRHYGLDAHVVHAGAIHSGHIEAGGFLLWVQVWTPQCPPRGTVVVVHGYFDHLGLYGHLLERLLLQGFRVVLWDLPGHGLSSGERASIDSFDTYVGCLRDLLSTLDDRQLLAAPLIGIGQSTGAAILATDALERRQDAPWQSLVLLAPLVRPCHWPRSRLIHGATAPFLHHIPRYYSSNTTDQAFSTFLRWRDPLQARTLPLAWVSAMRRWMARLRHLSPASLPVLILQGEQDATVDWRWNLPVLTRLLPTAQVVYHPQARHHLVNEAAAVRQPLFDALEHFLDEQIDSPCDVPRTP
nr:alpha/beta hydrolase [Kushneria aurantia]